MQRQSYTRKKITEKKRVAQEEAKVVSDYKKAKQAAAQAAKIKAYNTKKAI